MPRNRASAASGAGRPSLKRSSKQLRGTDPQAEKEGPSSRRSATFAPRSTGRRKLIPRLSGAGLQLTREQSAPIGESEKDQEKRLEESSQQSQEPPGSRSLSRAKLLEPAEVIDEDEVSSSG